MELLSLIRARSEKLSHTGPDVLVYYWVSKIAFYRNENGDGKYNSNEVRESLGLGYIDDRCYIMKNDLLSSSFTTKVRRYYHYT